MQSTQQALSQAIEVQRVRLGISKGDLARAAGYSPSSLSKRMSGLVALDTNDIDRLAKAMSLDPFELVALAAEEQRRTVAA